MLFYNDRDLKLNIEIKKIIGIPRVIHGFMQFLFLALIFMVSSKFNSRLENK